MKNLLRVVCFFFFTSLCLAQYEVKVTTINVWVKVTDKSGKTVPGLKQQDFQLFEDNQPVQSTCFEEIATPQTPETNTWAASVYVRSGDKWKVAFHGETPVVDPKAAAANAATPAKTAETKPAEAKPDALTAALMAVENKSWKMWKKRDAKGVEVVMATHFMFLSGTGRTDRAEAIKEWSEPKCEGIGYSLTEPVAVSLAGDAAFVTYHASVQGVCDGNPEPSSLWVASFDVKEGGAWRNAFYMDIQ